MFLLNFHNNATIKRTKTMKIANAIMTIRVVLLLPEVDFVDCGNVLRFEPFIDAVVLVEDMVLVL